MDKLDDVYVRLNKVEDSILAIDDYFESDNGKYFLAIEGDIRPYRRYIDLLDRICPSNYVVNPHVSPYVGMFKIVEYDKYRNREPAYDRENNLVSVSGFNILELKKVVKEFHHPELDIIKPHSYNASLCADTINYMYKKYGKDMFEILSKYMHFCSVIYDYENKCIIGGVTEPNSKYTNLYYGYKRESNELMYSNHEVLIDYYCDEVHKMPNNTYMINGELHSFKGKNNEIETKLKEILDSEYGRELINELINQRFQQYEDKGFSRILK